MRWYLTPIYLLILAVGIVLGIAGALGAAVLLALLVGVGVGAGASGATVGFWVLLPAWAGFAFFFILSFLWQRGLKQLLERILFVLALEAFALPLASMAFLLGHFERTVNLAGDQTVVWANVVGATMGGLGVVAAGILVALAVGGPLFLMFLLLRFSLTPAWRAPRLGDRQRGGKTESALDVEGRLRIGRTAQLLILLAVLTGIFSVGMVSVQLPLRPVSEAAVYGEPWPIGVLPDWTTGEDLPSPEPLPGVIVAGPMEDMMPMMTLLMRANRFFKYTELAGLGVLVRMNNFNKDLRASFGLGPSRRDRALQMARQLLESYLFNTGNPNLRVGRLQDLGPEIEGEIITHNQEVVEHLRVDKRTGALRAVW